MTPPQYDAGVLTSAIAEFVGTFYFVFCSCASTSYWPQQSNSCHTAVPYVAVLSGLSLAVVTHCTSGISIGYVNPVVSVALYLTQRLCRLRFFLYIPAQVLGGITGAAFHHVVAPNPGRGQEPATETADDSGLMQGFVIEFALAILFIFALFTVLFGQEKCCVHAQAAPWKIGLIYTLCLLIDVPYTSGGLNPILSLGSAVVTNKWGNYDRVNHWLYWVAPILGGALGGTLFEIWKAAGELNDIVRYSHFKRMVALLVILVLLIIIALVVTLAL